jgi:hypothetical protein
MAKYGFGTYGVPKYGEVDANRLYYASGIFGWSYDYQTISLTWKSIISDPDDAPYVPIAWRLVRSYVGVPDNPYVGDVLDSGALPSEFRLTYIDDESSLLENHEVTYTIWVFTASVDGTGNINGYANSRWINCGSTVVNTVSPTQTTNYFKRWMPAAWLNDVNGVGDAIGEANETSLSKTIDAYSFEYDKIKVQALLLQDYADSRNIPSNLLKNKVTDLGFLYEPSLGDTYHRSLYKNGNFINAVKGTTAAITTYATALTHWGATVQQGRNLMLDYNDASFEESVGRWISNGGGTISAQKYATSLADVGVALTPPTVPLTRPSWPLRQAGFGLVTMANVIASVNRVFYMAPSNFPNPPYNLAYIPVTAGKRYIFKGWVRHITSSAKVDVRIAFLDKDGGYLDQPDFWSAKINTTSSWQEFRSPSDGIGNGMLAPAGAALATVNIRFVDAEPLTKYAIDMLDFREADNLGITNAGKLPSYEYEDARLIKVNIEADLENYILNPSFDSGTSWWQGYNAEVVQDFNPPTTAKIFGTAVAKVTALSNSTAALISDWQVVAAGTPYTVGFYVSGPAGRTARVRLEYSSGQSYEDQVRILSDSDGKYYPTEPYYVDSEVTTLSATATRITAYAVSPVRDDNFSDPLAKSSVYFPDAQEGDVFYVDSVMLVELPTIEDYFQGDGAPVPTDPNLQRFFPTSDCSWDTRNQLNMVTNSAFADTSKWTAAEGTTFTVSTSNPLFGTKRGNVSASGGGSISTKVYYPRGACVGGEDVVISAYVKNVAGLYSISTNGQAVNSFRVSSTNASSWTRIHVNRIADIGETNFDITVSLSEAGSGTKVFHIDGVQAEFGRVATPFIDPSDSLTTTTANPAQTGETVSYRYSSMVNAGYSFYGARYVEKYQRLASSLGLVTPLGSTFSVNTHESNVGLSEISGTLLPAPSFELNLNGWTGVAANLKKSVSRGTIYDEVLTQGAAFCKVTSTASTAFGITTDLIDIDPVTGYYTSIAIKPENEDAYGTYTLKLKWYADSQGFLREKTTSLVINRHDRWAYLDIVAPGTKTVSISSVSAANNLVTVTTRGAHKFSVDEDLVLSINEYPSLSGPVTIEAVTETTFSFTRASSTLSDVEVTGSARFSNTGVSFAKIEITCEPTFAGVGRTFHLDKVIFKE